MKIGITGAIAMSETGHTHDLLKREVGALLESAQFARSKVNRALLSFLAERIVEGRAEQINEYVVAHDLLGRGDDFDPAIDPIVRVRMRRLREAITTFYDDNPRRLTQISLPRGSYILALKSDGETPQAAALSATEPERPLDHTSEDAPDGSPDDPQAQAPVPPAPAAPRSARWGAMRAVSVLVLLVAVGIGVFWVWQRVYLRPDPVDTARIAFESYPVIAIAPFSNLTGNPANTAVAKAFQRQIAGDFQRFGRARIWVLSADEYSEMEGSDFVLRGNILDLKGSVDVAVELSDSKTRRSYVDTRITRYLEGRSVSDALHEISLQISGGLGAQGGVISRVSLEHMDQNLNSDNDDQLDIYRCVTLTDRFLISYSIEQFEKAYQCFEELTVELETDPAGAASWGTLLLHAVPEFAYMDTDQLPERMRSTSEDVTAYANDVADLFPNSDMAFILFSAVNNAKGNVDLAIQNAQHAVALNPANPTSYAVLAYSYMAADLYQEARAAAQTAIHMSFEPAPYMYLPLLVAGLVQENARLVDEARQNMAGKDGRTYDFLLLAAAAMIGDQATVDALLAQTEPSDDPLALVRPFVQGQIGLGVLERYLESVGVNVPDAPCLDSVSGNVSRGLEGCQR